MNASAPTTTGVNSEVGRLRTVLVHRPGRYPLDLLTETLTIEAARCSPGNGVSCTWTRS